MWVIMFWVSVMFFVFLFFVIFIVIWIGLIDKIVGVIIIDLVIVCSVNVNVERL